MSRVSIIIPMFNAMRTLEATVASALLQTHRNTEVIIVDDGSSDGSGQCADAFATRDPRVRVIHIENSGVAAARNIGIAAATGEWIAPLDADDVWHPEKIERQLLAARTAPSRPAFVYAWSRRIDIDGHVTMDLGQPQFRGDVLAPLVASNFMRNSSVPLICRDALEATGGYDVNLQAVGSHGAEDLSIYLKLAEYGPVELVPAFLIGYRYFPGTMSRDPDRMRRSINLVLDELARRHPDLPPGLLSLATMNYDFYSASLARAAGDTRGFLAFIGKALRNRPLVGAAFLACILLERLSAILSPRQGVRFEDLSADAPLRKPDLALLDRVQAAAVRQAIKGSSLSGRDRRAA